MATDDAGIYARESASLDRYVQFGYASGRLLSVSFPREPDAEANGDAEARTGPGAGTE